MHLEGLYSSQSLQWWMELSQQFPELVGVWSSSQSAQRSGDAAQSMHIPPSRTYPGSH